MRDFNQIRICSPDYLGSPPQCKIPRKSVQWESTHTERRDMTKGLCERTWSRCFVWCVLFVGWFVSLSYRCVFLVFFLPVQTASTKFSLNMLSIFGVWTCGRAYWHMKCPTGFYVMFFWCVKLSALPKHLSKSFLCDKLVHSIERQMLRMYFYCHGWTALVGVGILLWGFSITLRHSAFGRTPLGEWSARRRDLNLTTLNTHKRQTFIPRRDSNPHSQQARRLWLRGHWGRQPFHTQREREREKERELHSVQRSMSYFRFLKWFSYRY